MSNLMERAITEGWLISEDATNALMVRKYLRLKNYLYFCSPNMNDMRSRLLSMKGCIYADVGCFYKRFEKPATIIQALFVFNPFEDYSQIWWDTLIRDEDQEAYVYARNGQHHFREFIRNGSDVEDSVIDCPKLFS